MLAVFITVPGGVASADIEHWAAVLRGTPAVQRALLFTPTATSDPYLDDGAGPSLAAQLYFTDIAALEAALAPDSHLAQAAPGLGGADVSYQAMLVRPFPMPEPGDAACTYLVSYEGQAKDLNLWLAHYMKHHPPLMARLPGIRELEVCTRVDWCGALPWRRAGFIQRNKVVFDGPDALTAALQSPVRHEMRADFHRLPAYAGPIRHYPMLTRILVQSGKQI